MVVTDPMTGLGNRRYFDRAVAPLFDQLADQGTPFSIVVFDVDRFKRVNDILGHDMGDIVLKEVAARLASNMRGIDVVSRYGGEEFAVILPNTNQAGALKVAENLLKEVSARQLTTGASSKPIGRITMSIGLALYSDNETLESFIDRADQCMYDAKRSGRNQVKAQTN